MKNKSRLKAIDFFCSWWGMSYWMMQAGINVIAGIDFDADCKATYEANVKGSKFILADVSELKDEDLTKETWIIKDDDDLILIGCSPCQFWTIIRTSKKKSQKSKDLLHEFHRFIKFYNPWYVVVENVPGILKKKGESGLDRFIESLEEQWYKVHYEVVHLNDYGVPESRKRFSLIANRIGSQSIFPQPDNSRPVLRDFIWVHNWFPKISAGHKDNSEFLHSTAGLSEKNLERLRLTPRNGGSRNAWSQTELQLEAYKRWGNISFSDTYGRMSWDRPASTITTKFLSISNGRFAHPEEDRAISLREGATLQTFPKSYKFIWSDMGAMARMIGNAVPPLYAKKLGLTIIKNHASNI